MAGFKAQIDAGAAGVAPDLYNAWAKDADTVDTGAWLRTKCTLQPAGTFARGFTLFGCETGVRRKHCTLVENNHPLMFSLDVPAGLRTGERNRAGQASGCRTNMAQWLKPPKNAPRIHSFAASPG